MAASEPGRKGESVELARWQAGNHV
jgi:hypothetical protein